MASSTFSSIWSYLLMPLPSIESARPSQFLTLGAVLTRPTCTHLPSILAVRQVLKASWLILKLSLPPTKTASKFVPINAVLTNCRLGAPKPLVSLRSVAQTHQKGQRFARHHRQCLAYTQTLDYAL